MHAKLIKRPPSHDRVKHERRTIMNKDLTWKLKAQPTAAELAELVKLGVMDKHEARDIIFNKGKREDASKLTTVVHVLLDGSGSMEAVRDATIEGYNEYVNSLKKDGGKFKFSLSVFDSGIGGHMRLQKVHENVYIDDVPELTRKTYTPAGGTPLYDAFCTTLKEAKSRKDEKHLFVVLTDGAENTSREFTSENMRQLKKQREDEGNWTFVYLGANQDSYKTAGEWGFSTSNVSNFNATTKGTGVVFASLATATRSYSAAPTMSTSSYFTRLQQEENENSK